MTPDQRFCRRCGLLIGAAPPPTVDLPECPVCYQRPADDGLFPSLDRGWQRVSFADHRLEHERFPVGDDEWLESLRDLDRIKIGRFEAPFALVRRYFVTGMLDGGRRRSFEHNALITAMAQMNRGPMSWEIGDQEVWKEAREAISRAMDRYHRV